MDNTIYIFIKAFIFAIIFDNPAIRLIIGLSIIGLCLYSSKKTGYAKKNIHISSLKLNNPYYALTFVGFFFINLSTILLIFRISNMGKIVDLRLVSTNLLVYLHANNYLTILGNIIYYISLFMLLIKSIIFIKKWFYVHFLRIHIYFLSKNFYKEKIIDFFYYEYRGIFQPIANYWYSYNISKNNLDPRKDMEAYFRFGEPYHKWFRFTEFLDNHLAIIIIILALLYDIIFNSFMLYIIFYILPIAYIILLWTNLVNFYKTRDHDLDRSIYLLLYMPYIIENHNIMIFSTGEYIDDNTRLCLTRYMLNDYIYTPKNAENIFDDIITLKKD